ncbi:MAG: hypothetical protein R2728_06240 [Chitinophagales bacterium]
MRKYIQTTLIAFTALFIVTSCSEEPQLIKVAPEQVVERIDMVLESDDREYIYKQSQESDQSEDLVAYNTFGTSSNNIDFNIRISDNRKLTIKLTNNELTNPWEYANLSYAIYPAQEEDDKSKFVRVELETTNEGTSNYISNYGNEFPNKPNLNAFTIEEYNVEKSELLCRIKDVTIIPENGNEGEAITLNGTFRGSLTF